MANSPMIRDSRSPSPRKELSKSRSRSRSRSKSKHRSRSRSVPRPRSRSRSRGRIETKNPGNTLYVTGLSTRITEKELKAHFSKEGKVASCFLVMEPHSRVFRGFAFVTMDSCEDADCCIKYLNQSVLEDRIMTVKRARRKRPRTPTPGHYLGFKSAKDYGGRDRDRDGSRKYRRDDYGHRRSPRRFPMKGMRDYSPPHRGERSRRDRAYSPYGSPDRRRPNHGSK